jgi:CBS domain-containing protein
MLRGVEIRDVMTESVVTAQPSATVRQVAELMRERNVGSVVLLDDEGALAGFVTDRDLALGALTDGRDAGDPVAAHSSSPVVTAQPNMDVEEAAELMVRHGIRRLPILDDGRLTGIITLDDIAVRTGDLELAHHMTAQITRAALPGFYFHDRGG